MSDRATVLVLMGGPDAEREVSLMSGREVAAALRDAGRHRVVEAVIDAPDADELAQLEGDVVFPVLHGRWGEGGGLQTELERLGRPYVGTGPTAAALAMDKLATKRFARDSGVPTPDAQLLEPGDVCTIEPPLVLKPVDDGSSVDMRICRTSAEVESARSFLHIRRKHLMAERYVAGRELTVGIVGDRALPIVEIIPSTTFYDYEAKYVRDDTRYEVDPHLPAAAQTCRDMALRVFRDLGCRDLARADFLLDDQGVWFLEINTMPGFTTHSLLPMAASVTGVEMGALCVGLVEMARARSAGLRPAGH